MDLQLPTFHYLKKRPNHYAESFPGIWRRMGDEDATTGLIYKTTPLFEMDKTDTGSRINQWLNLDKTSALKAM